MKIEHRYQQWSAIVSGPRGHTTSVYWGLDNEPWQRGLYYLIIYIYIELGLNNKPFWKNNIRDCYYFSIFWLTYFSHCNQSYLIHPQKVTEIPKMMVWTMWLLVKIARRSFQICVYVHPENWGRWTQFDEPLSLKYHWKLLIVKNPNMTRYHSPLHHLRWLII